MNAVVNEDDTQGEYKEERQMSKAASLLKNSISFVPLNLLMSAML